MSARFSGLGTNERSSLLREQEEAQEQLNHLLKQTRPKNFRDGFFRGASDIIAGAIGAVGIAILAPTAGFAFGVESGGCCCGIAGFACGACVGVCGACVMLTQGLCDGVCMILRGCCAIPDAIIQPRKGKWWAEAEGRWVETNLDKETQFLQSVPDDDEDILGDAKKDSEQGYIAPSSNSNVADTYFYDTLEVDPTVDRAKIKKQYYSLARKYHPDKAKDDPNAAEKFKKIAEAYQVLSDPELRSKYDKDGRPGLEASNTSDSQIDPAMLFAFLFGSDLFSPYIGTLSTATSASVADSTSINITQARKLQKRRCTRLAIQLASRLDAYITGPADTVKGEWDIEAQCLIKASYGRQLLKVIGHVYTLCSIQFLGSGDSGIGLPSISRWAKAHAADWTQTRDSNKNQRNTLFAGLSMLQMTMKYEQEKAKAITEEEKRAIDMEYQKELSASFLNILWTTTVIDITSTLHETCQMVLFDSSVTSDVRKVRAEALRELGNAFSDVEIDAEVEEKDVQQLYEEAAFAAMLETIKRKDEASFNASFRN